MNRKKISDKVQGEVIFRSHRFCVVCDNNKRGDHIHHIDGDANNNDFDNLAFLCFNCHNEASITGSLKKKLIPEAIRKYRDLAYKRIETQRENSLKSFTEPIVELTTENLLTTVKAAILVIEIVKIKEEYYAANWDRRSAILEKLEKFSEHANFRVAVDMFDFLSLVTNQASSGMTTDVALSIYSLILVYFPYSECKKDDKKAVEVANQCVNIAFDMIYDAVLHLKNYKIAMYGLTILKFVYKKGKELKKPLLADKVTLTYHELEQTLKRPDVIDLVTGMQLIREFKADLVTTSLAFPPLSENLRRQIEVAKD